MAEPKHTPALVVKLECGDTVIERASNFCSSTLSVAHLLLHAGGDESTNWKITIERRDLTSAEYDAIRQKFESDAMAEVIALDVSKHLAEAAAAEGPSDG